MIIGPILEGKADAVLWIAVRCQSECGGCSSSGTPLGNKVLTALSNMANDINLTDMETCYKAVKADVLHDLRLTSDRFGIEPEITARLARYGRPDLRGADQLSRADLCRGQERSGGGMGSRPCG